MLDFSSEISFLPNFVSLRFKVYSFNSRFDVVICHVDVLPFGINVEVFALVIVSSSFSGVRVFGSSVNVRCDLSSKDLFSISFFVSNS